MAQRGLQNLRMVETPPWLLRRGVPYVLYRMDGRLHVRLLISPRLTSSLHLTLSSQPDIRRHAPTPHARNKDQVILLGSRRISTCGYERIGVDCATRSMGERDESRTVRPEYVCPHRHT